MIIILVICWVFIIPIKLAMKRFPEEIHFPAFFIVLFAASVVAIIISVNLVSFVWLATLCFFQVVIIKLTLKLNRALKIKENLSKKERSHWQTKFCPTCLYSLIDYLGHTKSSESNTFPLQSRLWKKIFYAIWYRKKSSIFLCYLIIFQLRLWY